MPHDQPLRPAKLISKQKMPKDDDSGDHDHPGDLNSLFAQVNDLPADDPLRQPAAAVTTNSSAVRAEDMDSDLEAASSPTQPIAPTKMTAALATASQPITQTVTAGASVTVPNFSGESMRKAVETASRLGLGVQVLGSGVVHEQAPVAGTHVPPGTEIVLRFAR